MGLGTDCGDEYFLFFKSTQSQAYDMETTQNCSPFSRIYIYFTLNFCITVIHFLLFSVASTFYIPQCISIFKKTLTMFIA